MPTSLEHLFANNRAWAQGVLDQDANFFKNLALQQAPEYFWIGCSDSRVPANQITGLAPGQVFVHRNVANVVVHTDLNALSALQFAVDRLHVQHVMVVGHYGCAGVHAALTGLRVGLADNWLRHVRDVHDLHRGLLGACQPERRLDRLCELNVVEQVAHVCQTTVIQDAWTRGQAVRVHGWVYGLGDGLLRDLGLAVTSQAELDVEYPAAVERIRCSE